MYYGNSSNGYGYSPDRSRDVDRFNPSTRSNYSTTYNTNGYGCYQPIKVGYYDGAGNFHEN